MFPEQIYEDKTVQRAKTIFPLTRHDLFYEHCGIPLKFPQLPPHLPMYTLLQSHLHQA